MEDANCRQRSVPAGKSAGRAARCSLFQPDRLRLKNSARSRYRIGCERPGSGTRTLASCRSGVDVSRETKSRPRDHVCAATRLVARRRSRLHRQSRSVDAGRDLVWGRDNEKGYAVRTISFPASGSSRLAFPGTFPRLLIRIDLAFDRRTGRSRAFRALHHGSPRFSKQRCCQRFACTFSSPWRVPGNGGKNVELHRRTNFDVQSLSVALHRRN